MTSTKITHLALLTGIRRHAYINRGFSLDSASPKVRAAREENALQ
jgi:hypothetical protein